MSLVRVVAGVVAAAVAFAVVGEAVVVGAFVVLGVAVIVLSCGMAGKLVAE